MHTPLRGAGYALHGRPATTTQESRTAASIYKLGTEGGPVRLELPRVRLYRRQMVDQK